MESKMTTSENKWYEKHNEIVLSEICNLCLEVDAFCVLPYFRKAYRTGGWPLLNSEYP